MRPLLEMLHTNKPLNVFTNARQHDQTHFYHKFTKNKTKNPFGITWSRSSRATQLDPLHLRGLPADYITITSSARTTMAAAPPPPPHKVSAKMNITDKKKKNT